MIIIGITGTLGAGKGTIVDYLVNKHGFTHFSVRGFITEELHRRGMEINRDNMVVVANAWRSQYGAGYIAEQLFLQAKHSGGDCIIESIRTAGEIESLRKLGQFFLLAVDAPAEIRYQRIVQRASETDAVSFDVFLENEKREMTTTDPNKQNLSACIAQADFLIENTGNMEELNNKTAAIINEIKRK